MKTDSLVAWKSYHFQFALLLLQPMVDQSLTQASVTMWSHLHLVVLAARLTVYLVVCLCGEISISSLFGMFCISCIKLILIVIVINLPFRLLLRLAVKTWRDIVK